MPRGRPKFGYFIFGCPSDHEIEGSVLSESDAIKAVLSNRQLGSRLKSVTCTTSDSFRRIPVRKYAGIRYVHLGGHGSKSGVGFIGGSVPWAEVAGKLVSLFPALKDDDQRVLTLSCCFSKAGVTAMAPRLIGHFSAAYYFLPERVGFATAITTWNMFYLKKRLARPHGAIIKRINDFMGENVVAGIQIP